LGDAQLIYWLRYRLWLTVVLLGSSGQIPEYCSYATPAFLDIIFNPSFMPFTLPLTVTQSEKLAAVEIIQNKQ
jgi:hypothetical protein